MVGVLCCSCVRIKLVWYQLSALGVTDSKWKYIGSNLSLFSVVCNLGFPTIYKTLGSKTSKTTASPVIFLCLPGSSAQDGVSDSKCFLFQMIYSQVK